MGFTIKFRLDERWQKALRQISMTTNFIILKLMQNYTL